MDKNNRDTRKYAREMDKADRLSSFRDRFYKKEGQLYMDGNSLGLCSLDAEEAILRVLNEWKERGIGVWTEPDPPLFTYHDYLAGMLAPLIGAEAEEVTIHANTTVNIHTCIATFYKPTEKRYKILVDKLNFPTDLYAVEGQIKLKGLDPRECMKMVESREGNLLNEADIVAAMSDDVALILLPSVLYRSGQLLDLFSITQEAHRRGIVIGWDLSHSIGAVPHRFDKVQPDFAVWCNYKYMNGGPGTSAGLYINKQHFSLDAGLPGWHGNKYETQFQLNTQFEKAEYAGGWQTGTQPVISMAAIEGSLKIYQEAGIENLRQKSLRLTGYLMQLIDSKLEQYGFSIINPREDAQRGGHVALVHEEALRINEALKAAGVVPDFRFPNVIRLAPVPLYTSFEDVYELVERIVDIMDHKKYEAYEKKIGLIA